MKLKIALLIALLGYSSISSAFTLYQCKSVDKHLNQTLTLSETPSRAPSEDVTVKVSSPDAESIYLKLIPQGTKTNGTLTVNTFANSKSELKILTNNPNIHLGPKKNALVDDFQFGNNCTRAGCPNDNFSRLPVILPDLEVKKITTNAVLIHHGVTTTYQCND